MQVLCSGKVDRFAYGWRGRECCVNNINLSTGICRPHLSDLGKLVENAGFLALPHNHNYSQSWTQDESFIIIHGRLWCISESLLYSLEAVVLSFHVWTRKPNESGALFPGIRPWTCQHGPSTPHLLWIISSKVHWWTTFNMTERTRRWGRLKPQCMHRDNRWLQVFLWAPEKTLVMCTTLLRQLQKAKPPFRGHTPSALGWILYIWVCTQLLDYPWFLEGYTVSLN